MLNIICYNPLWVQEYAIDESFYIVFLIIFLVFCKEKPPHKISISIQLCYITSTKENYITLH